MAETSLGSRMWRISPRPDVAVLDISMPGLIGIQVAREAVREQPELAVLLCSVHGDPQLIQASAEAGALGYVSKVDLFRDLEIAVDEVAAGHPFFPPGVQLPRIPIRRHKAIPTRYDLAAAREHER